MLAIKLQRIGKKHQPSFRVVVAEKRSKLGGPPVEDLGSYNPRTKAVTVAKEKVEHWLKVGAKATPTVHNLLVKAGVVSAPKMVIKINKAKGEKAEAAAPAAQLATEVAVKPEEPAGAEAKTESKTEA